MEDMNLLISFIAIILSLASVILVIIRIGIGLGLEFVEKKEIREMRKKIDNELTHQWVINLQDFLKKHCKKLEDIEKGIIDLIEIRELGEATRYIDAASTMLKILSKMIFRLVKLFIALVVTAIVLALTIWGAFALTEIEVNWWGISAISGVIFVALVLHTRDTVRNYLSLRSQFYELYENPSLFIAKEIIEELEERELIYA